MIKNFWEGKRTLITGTDRFLDLRINERLLELKDKIPDWVRGPFRS